MYMNKSFLVGLSLCFCFAVPANAQLLTMGTAVGSKTSEEKAIAPKNRVGEEETKSYVWEFWSAIPEKFDDPKYQNVEVDVFGKEVACLRHLFETSYVTREKMIPGDPTERTVIKKQPVYNATRNIEKFYRKELKKGEIDKQQVIQDYSHVLKVAVAVVSAESMESTESFEAELNNNKKDLSSLIEVFKKVKLNNIYSSN